MKNRVLIILLAALFGVALIVYLIVGGGAGSSQSQAGFTSSAAGSVLINEAMASNPGIIPAPDGQFYDWIELYNPSSEAVDLSNWGLSDQANVAAKWTFGSGTTIEPGGYLLVYCSDLDQNDPGKGALHTSFKLKSGSDTVVLSDSTGKTVDALPLAEVTSGSSLGREAGNTGEWLEFAEPTPGFENSEAGRKAYLASMDGSAIGLKISEFQSSNKTTLAAQDGSYPDWVEIHNPTGAAIDLSGFGLSDKREKPMRWTFPEGTTIEAGGYLLVYCDGVSDLTGQYPGELHASFSLSAYEESVVLSSASGQCIDAVDYKGIPADASYIQTENGTWEVTAKPTPGYPNTDEGFTAFQEHVAAAYTGSGLIISEIMLSNSSYVPDGGGYYDWIELHNTTNETIDLSGWGLSDKSKNPLKWTFPEGTAIGAGQYLLVQASGLDVKDPSAAKKTCLHTNFSLSSAGEIILLSKPDGTLADKLNCGRLIGGVSYGRSDGGTPLYYQKPTPGEANGTGYPGYAKQPEILLAAGFYPGTKQAEVSVPDGTKVYYTTDGSVPDESDTPYTGPITIEQTTSLRVRAFADGLLPSQTATASYLIASPHSSGLSVVFVSMENSDLYDENTGIYVYGPNPGSAPTYKTANFNQEWERACHVEIFDGSGNLQVSQDLAIRIFGAFSRLREQKGFALIARNENGANTIEYPLFENRDAQSYKSIVLRAGAQDSTVTKIKDIVATGLVDGTTNLQVQAYRQAVLYINGQYFGVYNIREKVTRYFIGAHYPDYDIDNLDILVGNGSVVQGSNKEYKEMISWCAQTDFAKDENYEKLCSMVDIDNYIDYLIAEMYVANTDSGNIKFFRERSSDPERSKWKWIYYDFCWTFLGVKRDFVEWFTNPAGHGVGKGFSNQLTISLMQNQQFRNRFLKRSAELLNSIYTPENVLAKIAECSETIYPEMERKGGDPERWPEGGGFRNWKACVKSMRNFARQRRNYMIDALQNYFSLSDSETLRIFGEKDVVELE